jgi:hypothetical protein
MEADVEGEVVFITPLHTLPRCAEYEAEEAGRIMLAEKEQEEEKVNENVTTSEEV